MQGKSEQGAGGEMLRKTSNARFVIPNEAVRPRRDPLESMFDLGAIMCQSG